MKNLILTLLVLTGALTMTNAHAEYIPGKTTLYLNGRGVNDGMKITVNNISFETFAGEPGSPAYLSESILIMSQPGKNVVKVEGKTPWTFEVREVSNDDSDPDGKLLSAFEGSNGTFEYTLAPSQIPVFDWFSGQDLTEADCAAAKAKVPEVLAALQAKDGVAFRKIQLPALHNIIKTMSPESAKELMAPPKGDQLTEWSIPGEIECHISTNRKIVSLNAKGEAFLFKYTGKDVGMLWGLNLSFYKNAAGELLKAIL